jgi:hypothetical protein
MTLKGTLCDLALTIIFLLCVKFIIWVLRQMGWAMEETTVLVAAVSFTQWATMKLTILGLDRGGWLRRKGLF